MIGVEQIAWTLDDNQLRSERRTKSLTSPQSLAHALILISSRVAIQSSSRVAPSEIVDEADQVEEVCGDIWMQRLMSVRVC